MLEKAKLNIALIGLGSIAQKAYLPILANHPKVNPILCTRNVPTLNKLANRYRIHSCYSNLEDLIKSKPDAAMVHSTTESHPAILRSLVENEIPVFVDKPLTYSLEASEAIINRVSKNKLPLFVGFNRRYAPLIRTLKEASNPIHISWQKNRVDLPGDPRVFIFDDFIHVVDSLRFLGKGEVKNLHVFAQRKRNLLAQIHMQWEAESTMLTGTMNRISGKTEEIVEYYTPGNKWVIRDLHSGTHYSAEQENKLPFNNWEATLYKRGFVDMMDDWIGVVEKRQFNPAMLEDIWKTHQLCEEVLGRVLSAG